MIELSPADHAEIVARLEALRQLADDISAAFDDEEAQEGARKMLSSIERMLTLLGTDAAPD
jgi:hypothetical protein